MFLQLHALTSYPGSLLNRDDVGQAKRLTFGGVERTRVSSQCLKRHWRVFEGDGSLSSIGVPMSVRSRRTFEEMVRRPLEKSGVAPEIARAITEAMMGITLGESEKKKESDERESLEMLQTAQVVVLGAPEIAYLLTEAKKLAAGVKDPKDAREVVKNFAKGARANLRALKIGAGLDAAVFGRMVTSDVLARCDAAIHVAHAFTVHKGVIENDYFSVIDELFVSGENPQMGSGHVNTAELTSGLFYLYVVIDVPQLVSNVEGCPRRDWKNVDPSLAASIVENFTRLVATVSPGAKLGSTAPYSYAQMLLAEWGTAQPRSLANAFQTPVDPGANLLQSTYTALAGHLLETDAMYGRREERRFAAIQPIDLLHKVAERDEKGISGLCDWAASRFSAKI